MDRSVEVVGVEGEPDEPGALGRGGEAQLVGVDVLAADGVAGDAHGSVAQAPGVTDQPGSAVADHRRGLGDERAQLRVGQVRVALGPAGGPGGAVLDDDPHPGSVPVAPAVGEVHQTVERVVVGAGEEQHGSREEVAHSSGPTRRASGYTSSWLSHCAIRRVVNGATRRPVMVAESTRS